jgi:lipopolysaccharide biosynthesis protein
MSAALPAPRQLPTYYFRLARRLAAAGGRRGPQVVEATRGDVRVQGADQLRGLRDLSRAAVVAHWSRTPRLSRSVRRLLAELRSGGYTVVLVSTCEASAPLDLADTPDVTVLRRANIGYDFGSWAVALDRYPALTGAEHLLLLNDSLAGPFASLGPLLDRFHSTVADVWSVTDSDELVPHVQSWCVGYRHGVLRDGPLAGFWRGVRHHPGKQDTIWWGELRLSRLLARSGLAVEVAVPHAEIVGAAENPTLQGWRGLLDHGVPLVKRELLRNPHLVPDGRDVRPELRRRFGVDVEDWL